MDFMSILRLAMRALARNKMRSILTMLGIIIGVGAVIASVAVGEGASEQIQQQISNLGDNMIWVEAGGRAVNGVRTGTRGTKTLVIGDIKAMQQQVPLVYNCAGHVDGPVQIVYGNQNWYAQARGISPEFLFVRRWDIARGSSFSQDDIDHAADVCLLGQTIVENLFGSADPLGQTIRIQNLPVRVIGILSPKGQSPTGQDQDDTLMMPLTTMQKKIKGIDWLDDIMCSGVSPAAIKPAEQQITSLLRERHHLRSDEEEDFNLRHPAGEHRLGVAGGRGDRDYEHHARFRYRAHPRNRPATGHWRERRRRAHAVPGRGHLAEPAGRGDRSHHRRSRFAGHFQHVTMADSNSDTGASRRGDFLCRRGGLLRLLSCLQGLSSGSDRGASV